MGCRPLSLIPAFQKKHWIFGFGLRAPESESINNVPRPGGIHIPTTTTTTTTTRLARLTCTVHSPVLYVSPLSARLTAVHRPLSFLLESGSVCDVIYRDGLMNLFLWSSGSPHTRGGIQSASVGMTVSIPIAPCMTKLAPCYKACTFRMSSDTPPQLTRDLVFGLSQCPSQYQFVL